MRWQTVLRGLIAVAGLGFAVFLYVRFDRSTPVAQAPVPPPLPKDASYQSKTTAGSRQCRYQDGKEVSCVSFTKFTQFTDGRRVIEQPKFEGDRGGKPFVVSADRGELRAAAPNAEPNEIPEETHLIGHVVMRELDGMEINTEDATYQESAATLVMPGPMTFHRDRLSGSGVGASYVRGDQFLRINDQAKVAMAPDESGRGKLDGNAHTMELNRVLHSLLLNGDAVIVRDEETIRTDVATMHLLESEQGITVMQMRGRSGIVPLDAAGQSPEMHSDDIDLEFHADGRTISRSVLFRKATLALAGKQGRRQITGDQLDVQLAPDGHTVKSLVATSSGPTGLVQVSLPQTADAPRRVIRARQFNASGNETDGLTAATFQDAVDFVEQRAAGRGQAAVDRHLRSRTMALTLNGDIGDIKEARFRDAPQDQVRFENGTTTGRADDVIYKAAAGTLTLRPGPQARRSEVDAASINVKAKNIDIELERTGIVADGDVRTETKPEKDSQTRGIFDETKSVSGSAATLRYDDTAHRASYEGGARLWQGAGKDQTRIQADKISLDDAAGDLEADGKVVAFLPMSNVTNGAEAPKASAAKFRYADSAHRATFTGTPKELAQFTGPDGTVKAVTIELTLSTDGHELMVMVANGSVAARVSADQVARGDQMTYDVRSGLYSIGGQPAKMIRKKVEAGEDRCTQTLGMRMAFKKAGSGPDVEMTVGTLGTGTTTLSVPNCQDWIIK